MSAVARVTLAWSAFRDEPGDAGGDA
jgi:hypothetical protein